MLIAFLAACTGQNAASPGSSASAPAASQAADLRARMDLLLSEQVIVVAKESAAAVNHSDEYGAYASLLGLNAADLSDLVARAYGNTAGVQFMEMWTVQDGYLVDYAIGVVTHNDQKSNAAIAGLNATYVPQFTQLIAALTHLPAAPTAQVIAEQIGDEKSLIDDVFAGDFKAYYADVHRAYVHATRLGDLLAVQAAAAFPDRFPGEATDRSANGRVALNLDLQEHSYLATMATDAALNHRDAEATMALAALAANVDTLRAAVGDPRFGLLWSQEVTSLHDYALTDDPRSRATLTDSIASELAAVTRANSSVIVNHENASIRAVDDQRSDSPTLADDDRAAATSMQPIADSVK